MTWAEAFLAVEVVRVAWSDCRQCDLADHRRSVVVGTAERFESLDVFAAEDEVDADADHRPFESLWIVGEAPGEVEDREGIAFIGPSGILLRERILAEAGVRDAVILNCVACRPRANREPREAEIRACRPRLSQLALAVPPVALIAVGRVAETHCTSLFVRGKDVFAGLPRADIVHPAWLLRQGWPEHPTPAAEAKAKYAIGAIKRLLRAVRGEPDAPGPAAAVSDHVHEPVACGSFVLPDGRRETILACRRCAKIVEEPPCASPS